MRLMPPAVLLATVIASVSAADAQRGPAPRDADVREAAARAVGLVQQSIVVWDSRETCNSCHHQTLPAAMLRAAAEHGIPFDREAAHVMLRRIKRPLADVDTAVQAANQIDPSMSWGSLLVAADDAGIEANVAMQAYARWIASRQEADGHWTTIDVRPPQAFSQVTATAIAARAVDRYLPPQMAATRVRAITHAARWLAEVTPRDAEERAFQVIGLAWTAAPQSAMDAAAGRIRTAQQADGGWAQLPRLASDAYATGQALVALRRAGTAVTDAAWQRGLRFLLDTQQRDGSWHVATRLHEQDLVSPPYFESGFPHGRDQFISCMGTAWAVMALAEALPRPIGPVRALSAAENRVPATAEAPWLAIAQSGSVDQLRAALDGGVPPNAATPAGTTVLMAAAHDPAKVRLLLARGADARATARSGHTALMLAANTRGAIESMRLMLEAGASAEGAPGESVRDLSPMLYAIWSGEIEKLRLLFDRGASLPRRVSIGGIASVTPLELAVFLQSQDIVRLLVERGADPNEIGEFGISPVSQAVLTNDPAMIRLLVSIGADVNQVDQHGETALMHAALVDYGESQAVEMLLALGAKRDATAPDGRKPLAMARQHGHVGHARRLE